MMERFWEIFTAIITSGVAIAVIEWVRSRRKDKADAKRTESESDQVDAAHRQLDIQTTNAVRDLWRNLSEDMREEMGRQKVRITDLETETSTQRSELDKLNGALRDALHYIDELLSGIGRLMQQIKDMGGTPVWRPGEWRGKK